MHARFRRAVLLGACAGLLLACGGKKKEAAAPTAGERVGSRAIDYVPRGTDFAVHLNAAKLRKSPLFLAAVGVARSQSGPEWLAFQEKTCGFPLLYVLEDVVFTRGEDGEVIIARLGVGTDEMSQCWSKLRDPKAKLPFPSNVPAYEFFTRDGLAFWGDPHAIARVRKMAKPVVHDPRKLELAGDEAMRADGSIDVGPFRSTSVVLETDKSGFRAEATLEAYSDTMAGAVHQKLAAIRDRTLEYAKNPLARDLMKSIRLSSNGSALTVRVGYHGTADEQLRYIDFLVELGIEVAMQNARAEADANKDAGADAQAH